MNKFDAAAFASLVLAIGAISAGVMIEARADDQPPPIDQSGPLDPRLPVNITKTDQAFIRGQMRDFLMALQMINEAALDGDREAIAEEAAYVGADHPDDPAPRGMGKRLPPDFRQIGQELRGDFRAIAAMAPDAPIADIQRKTNEAMLKCVACHAGYRVELAPAQ